MAFRPNDGAVWLLYGIYKHRKKEYEDALRNYKEAEKLIVGSPDLQYNLGLLYFDMKMYSMSLEYAKKAYSKGYPLPGLKKKLIRAGKWK